MKYILQKIADFLENLSRKIAPNRYDRNLASMNRKELINLIKWYQIEMHEVENYYKNILVDCEQAKEDLQRQIIRNLDDAEVMARGDLHPDNKLEATPDILGAYGDAINLVLEDFRLALQCLPKTHPLCKKYRNYEADRYKKYN